MAREQRAAGRRAIGLENPADEVNGVGLSNLSAAAPGAQRRGALAKGDKAAAGPQRPGRSEHGSRRRGRSASDRRADEGQSVGRGRGG
jgi:hypothetical protein